MLVHLDEDTSKSLVIVYNNFPFFRFGGFRLFTWFPSAVRLQSYQQIELQKEITLFFSSSSCCSHRRRRLPRVPHQLSLPHHPHLLSHYHRRRHSPLPLLRPPFLPFLLLHLSPP